MTGADAELAPISMTYPTSLPPLPGSGPLTRWLAAHMFDRRHRHLVDTFGRG